MPRILAAENPCYPLIPQAFRSAGYTVVPLDITGAGTGVAIPLISPEGHLQLEADANVVYLGGMPQALAPELCIHYMVLPKAMLPAFRSLGQQSMFEPSSPRIYQRAMEHFIRDGHFERHIRRMRNVYRRKMNLLKEALSRSFGGKGDVDIAVTGLHLVMTVTSRCSEETLTEAAKQAGIRIAPASPYTTGHRHREDGFKRELLIGFGGIPEEHIETGASALAQILLPLLL
ncbi:aminotransferase-like domain-containing protein [Paenibacillus sp. CAU 1782]